MQDMRSAALEALEYQAEDLASRGDFDRKRGDDDDAANLMSAAQRVQDVRDALDIPAGEHGNEQRAAYGRAAIAFGSPDLAENDACTNAVDTIANVLHAFGGTYDEADAMLRVALNHYYEERA